MSERPEIERAPVDPSWFIDAFGARYLDVYRARSSEQAVQEAAAVMRRWDLPSGSEVLDLCCGAGRHLEPLASYPIRVVGLDRSESLLGRARARFAGALPLIVQGDMRALPFERAFDGVAMFFTSFGYFFDDDENRTVLREIARVLRPGGRLMLDLMDKRSVVESLVAESARTESEHTIRERRWITADGRRVEKEIFVQKSGESPQRFAESVRLLESDEISSWLSEAGFGTIEFTGTIAGDEYRPGVGPRMVAWCRRSADA